MEGKNEIVGLITKYLLNEVNAEEKIFIEDWINANEQNRRYFKELKTTWRLMVIKQAVEKVDVDHEWNLFKQATCRTETKLRYILEQEKQDVEITTLKRPFPKAIVYRIMISTAIAASVLFVIALGWRFITSPGPSEKQIVQKPVKIRDPAPEIIKHELNTSVKRKRLVLPDGSYIVLYENSEVSYPEPFRANSRDISLKGKAEFNVAKDLRKPFTVLSKDISTTVTGTKFIVTAFDNTNHVIIRLYEGRVVVRSASHVKRKLGNTYYMIPGQEFIYNSRAFTAVLRNIQFKKPAINHSTRDDISYDDPSIPENNKGSWYMFNNQSLEQVFEQLQEMYNADIQYSRRDISNMYFIGKFAKSDSLESILKQIAFINKLKLTKTDDKFIISK
ncbi:MAG: FecR family protein [Chitinophagaceae bacterium]